jgi:acetylornithine deacetylase/succinyl-diaminopimelate desuccinylase-like protein
MSGRNLLCTIHKPSERGAQWFSNLDGEAISMNNKAKAEKAYEKGEDRFISEWQEFINFKSVSSEAVYEAECRACAGWVVEQLARMGLEAEPLETITKPVVFGRRAGDSRLPRIIFYGHYDVQPVDPIAAWQSDPFKGEIRGGRMYARGAEDNKGQVMFFLKALESLLAAGELRNPISVIIEGEEEAGSRGLTQALASWRERLQADVLMVCDSGALRAKVPCIAMGIRGIVFLEVELGGLKHDLHSGSWGGVVKNPAVELARMISTLHDAQGRIAVPGYYDTFKEASPEDRALAKASELSAAEIESISGVPPAGGEQGRGVAERRGLRPTIEVNGLWSGYIGEGMKTIIPAFARAKITSRLVAGQEPGKCLDLIIKHLQQQAPTGLVFRLVAQSGDGEAVALSVNAPLVQRARKVLTEISGGPVDFTWEGGSIPVVAALAKVSGAQPLMVGFGLPEDQIHAPNESFSLEQFRDGYIYSYLMLLELATTFCRQ